jgi:predicted Zn-dependent protease
MSHVTERHAVRQARASTPFTVLFGVPAAILGTVSPTLGGIVGGTGQLLSKVTLAPYGRDQEREADERGIALAARAGWIPWASPHRFIALHEEEALAAGDPDRGGFLATHPSSRERVATIQDLARKQGRHPPRPSQGRGTLSSAGSRGW